MSDRIKDLACAAIVTGLLSYVAISAIRIAVSEARADNRSINFGAVITDLDDRPVVECVKQDASGKCLEDVPLTLGRAAMRVLTAKFPDDGNIDGVEVLRRYDLANKLFHATGPVQTTDEERVLIKRLVLKGYSGVVYGRAAHMLDGD